MALAQLVYPGAVHTRLHHSLGAYHLMCTAIAELKDKGVDITDEEAQAAKAAILSNAAATGQLGSSSTQQALQQADIAAQQQRYTISTSMYNTGVNEILKGDQILGAIGQQQLAQDKELQTALGGVVQMFAGKDSGSTIDLLKGLFS